MPRPWITLQAMALLLCVVGGADAETPRVPTLERDVEPILTRFGCNAGACHGKQRGQNGFQLSLLGFDPDFDLDAMVHEARGRRIFPAAPDESLVLLKSTARLPHGGGKRLDPGSDAYKLLREWIARGTQRDPPNTPQLLRITVLPSEQILTPGARLPLSVAAHFSDGSTEDVTRLTAFQSNETAIASISSEGLIKAGTIPGEVAVTARFRGQFATCYITIPLPGSVPAAEYARLPRKNPIDGLVWDKLKKLGITPSEPASDATFLRRVSLDVIGRLPSAEEVRSFLADTGPAKREQSGRSPATASRIRRSLGEQVDGSAATQSVPRGHQGGLQPRRLDSPGVPP